MEQQRREREQRQQGQRGKGSSSSKGSGGKAKQQGPFLAHPRDGRNVHKVILPQESGDSPPRLPPELVLPQAPVTPAVTVGFFKKQILEERKKQEIVEK